MNVLREGKGKTQVFSHPEGRPFFCPLAILISPTDFFIKREETTNGYPSVAFPGDGIKRWQAGKIV